MSAYARVLNDNAVRTRGTCAVPTRTYAVPHHKLVLGTRYSGTVPCCTNHDTVYYVQLHIDDAILCSIDDVMILLYWDTDDHLVLKNCKG